MFYSHAFPSQIVCSERGWGEREKRGRGGGKKKENIGLVLRFFTFAVCPFLKLYFFSSSSLGLPLSSMRLSSSRVVFLESKDCFVLSCLICVSGGGKKCTGAMECEVRRGEEREEGKERWREKERERQTEGGGGGRRGLGLKRHTRAARNQSPVSIGRAPSLSSQ